MAFIFLARDDMLASLAWYNPCGRLSVTSWCYTERAKHVIMPTTPRDSQGL